MLNKNILLTKDYIEHYRDSLGDVYEIKADSRFVTTDFLVLEFLIALHHNPVGATDLADYEDRVSIPKKLPKGIADLGQSDKPNLELLKSLDPDFLIIDKNYLGKNINSYKKIIPTIVIDVFGFRKKYLDNILNEFQKFAKFLHKEDIAQEITEKYQKTLITTADLIKNKEIKKALFIQIFPEQDNNLSIRIHSKNCYFAELMEKLGMEFINNPKNIEKPSEWGFHTYTVQEFSTVDLANTTLFISVNDQPIFLRLKKKHLFSWVLFHKDNDKKKVMRLVKKNLILNTIFKKQKIHPYVMESAWPWGGVLSAIRFLENIKNCIKNNNHLSV